MARHLNNGRLPNPPKTTKPRRARSGTKKVMRRAPRQRTGARRHVWATLPWQTRIMSDDARARKIISSLHSRARDGAVGSPLQARGGALPPTTPANQLRVAQYPDRWSSGQGWYASTSRRDSVKRVGWVQPASAGFGCQQRWDALPLPAGASHIVLAVHRLYNHYGLTRWKGEWA